MNQAGDVAIEKWNLKRCSAGDLHDVRAAHSVFPVTYDDKFYESVCCADSSLFTVRAAPVISPTNFAGVATARTMLLSSCSFNDMNAVIRHLDIDKGEAGGTKVLYVLTLVVALPFRRQGLGRVLLRKVEEVRCPHSILSVVSMPLLR
jgi:ribosomal protein S18 acetylase RimI-like enzyme